ncbi:MAG: hypothetical protein BBJ60_10925 [Desulfobacterales bacterium S7086C20]|nr:MAG: hypothetical protein BBJ60_10925 [Desulfobacterales bacterium S7086C20]
MTFQDRSDTPEILSCEKDRLRALSIYIIRSIVEQHEGQVEEDEISRCIDISVPDAEASLCAEQIGEQMGLMCYCMYTHVDALFKGKLPPGLYNN